MKEQFVDHELALELKMLGFSEECIKGFYNKEELYTVVTTPVDFNNKKQTLGELVSCPLYQQAFDFFENNYNVFATIDISSYGKYFYNITDLNKLENIYPAKDDFLTKKEAQKQALVKLIEIVKKNENKIR